MCIRDSPEGEGADRGVLRGMSTWKILVIMVLVKGLGDYGFGDSGTLRVEAALTVETGTSFTN